MFIFLARANDCFSLDGDESGPPCIFPFFHVDKFHTECKWEIDGTEWCPTKVDSTARGVKWGLCGPGCPKLDSKEQLLFAT
jgi:hypothetical protein